MKLAQITALPKQLVLAAIACYRLTRFFRTPSCRFYPTCSKYMSGCVQKHGLVRGLLLTLVRLSKCHPLHPGGVDEVPDRLPPGCNHGNLVVENISDDLNRAIV